MKLRQILPPAGFPVTLGEAKNHLHTFGSDDDELIMGLIAAATQGAEHLTGRALMLQTWELAMDGFPHPLARPDRGIYSGAVEVPKPPLVSVVSVKYVDTMGTLQPLESFQLDDYNEPAQLLPAYRANWPATRCQPNSVLIRFECGYRDSTSVPQEIKQWMLLRIGLLYENREAAAAGVTFDELPHVDGLLDAHRVWRLV